MHTTHSNSHLSIGLMCANFIALVNKAKDAFLSKTENVLDFVKKDKFFIHFKGYVRPGRGLSGRKICSVWMSEDVWAIRTGNLGKRNICQITLCKYCSRFDHFERIRRIVTLSNSIFRIAGTVSGRLKWKSPFKESWRDREVPGTGRKCLGPLSPAASKWRS